MAVAQHVSDIGSVRRSIFKAARDPAIAEQVFNLAVASRGPSARSALPWLTHGPLFAAQVAPPPLPMPGAEHLAYDLCVYLTFFGPQQAARAQQALGPANWQVVRRMGGWQALHAVAPHYRRRTLLRQLAPLLTCARTGACTRGGRRLRAARASEAWELLMSWQAKVPSMADIMPEDLVAQSLSLGALSFLLGKLAAACDGWSAGRTRQAWLRLAAKCPEV